MNYGAIVLPLGLMILLLVSVAAKIDAYVVNPRVTIPRTLAFRTGGCAGTIQVAAIPATGDARDMLRALAGAQGRLSYVYDGRVYRELPVFRAYLGERFAKLLLGLGFSPRSSFGFVLAVIEP